MDKNKIMTDEELAISYIGGNHKAFDELLLRNQNKLYSYILFIVHDKELANDLFQDTFVKAIMKMNEGKYQTTGKFSAWLMRIAHNVIIDKYREQKADRIIEWDEDNDLSNIGESHLKEYDIECKYIKQQILNDVKSIMEQLPTSQKEVVFMRFYQNLSFKEIAEITNVSINTSLGRMRYALMNMRRIARDNQVILTIE